MPPPILPPPKTPAKPRSDSRASGVDKPGEKRKRKPVSSGLSPQQRKAAKVRSEEVEAHEAQLSKEERRKQLANELGAAGGRALKKRCEEAVVAARANGTLKFCSAEHVYQTTEREEYEEYRRRFEEDYKVAVYDQGLSPEEPDTWKFELVHPTVAEAHEKELFVPDFEDDGAKVGEDDGDDEGEDEDDVESEGEGEDNEDGEASESAAMEGQVDVSETDSEAYYSPMKDDDEPAKDSSTESPKRTQPSRAAKGKGTAKPKGKPVAKPKKGKAKARNVSSLDRSDRAADRAAIAAEMAARAAREVERLKIVAQNLTSSEEDFVEVEYRAGDRIPTHETARTYAFGLWYGEGCEDLDKAICGHCARNLTTRAKKDRMVCHYSGKFGKRCDVCAKSKKGCVKVVSGVLSFCAAQLQLTYSRSTQACTASSTR